MPVHNPKLPFHQQDTDYYCGAACAQMVLNGAGAGLLDQDSLYDENHCNSSVENGWYTGPDGLVSTMHAHRPRGYARDFALFALDEEDAISRTIVWSLYRHGVPAIALVLGSDHWIVVRGYDTSADPQSAEDTSYSIDGFYINNPWPPTPDDGPPPPHADDTDGCGTGDTRGVANAHVTRAAWQDTYMTGVPTGYWAGKYLAVCDSAALARPSSRVTRPDPPRDGKQILPPSEVADLAIEGMTANHLADQSGWSKAIARKDHGGEPVLVQRIDRADTYYYLIRFEADEGPSVFASVDARFGRYGQSVVVPPTTGPHLETVGEEPFINRLKPFRHMLGGLRGGGILLRQESVSVSPTLVWKPCRESLSPFYPFHVVTIGGRRLYYRVDGRLFTHLTPAGRGL